MSMLMAWQSHCTHLQFIVPQTLPSLGFALSNTFVLGCRAWSTLFGVDFVPDVVQDIETNAFRVELGVTSFESDLVGHDG